MFFFLGLEFCFVFVQAALDCDDAALDCEMSGDETTTADESFNETKG